MPQHLIACHDCDTLHHYVPIHAGSRARCVTCQAPLYKKSHHALDRAIALHLTAFILIIMANSVPFMALAIAGKIEQNHLISSSWILYQLGMGELGLLIFATSIAFPLINTLGTLYLLIAAKIERQAPAKAGVYRVIHHLKPWSLTGVFMLGILISLVKLMDMAQIIPGVALFAFIALLWVSLMAQRYTDHHLIWPKQPLNAPLTQGSRLQQHRLCLCPICHHINPLSSHCSQCHSALHLRKKNSLNRTMALLITACVLLIPANLYPIMTVIQLGQGEPNTIISGVIHLIEANLWPLALLVFFASIIIPVLKILVIGFLTISVKISLTWRPKDRTRLYRITELLGAWSMVDIYIIGILAALVNLGALATIEPGIGATFFALAVITTMIAAHSFDPRLIWDPLDRFNDGTHT